MDLNSKYYSSQLEAIQNFYQSLQAGGKSDVTLPEAIVTWLTDGHAEKFREEFLKQEAAILQ